MLDGHTNNGWIYEDEADMTYRKMQIECGERVPELRKRPAKEAE